MSFANLNSNLVRLGAASAVMLAPVVAFAQEAAPAAAEAAAAAPDVAPHVVYIMNSLLFLVSGFLVFFMAAGFAMLEAGLVRSKNVSMQLTKNVALFGIAALLYLLVGYNLMYPGDNWTILNVIGAFSITSLQPVGATAADVDVSYASAGSDFFFQLMFCAATASIVSGTLAERIKLWPFLVFTAILTGLIYPIQASWKWGGGFLDTNFGFLDFAGSTVVHSVGGWAALVGAIILGARAGKYGANGQVNPIPGSNMGFATLGTFILWLGWFGFNGGSQLAMGSIGDVTDVSRIFANTNMAAVGGSLAAMALTQILYKKIDITMVLNGALAGLVSITAEPLTPSLVSAVLIGAVGGILVVVSVPLLDKLKIDDVVGAIPVHLVCGIWGTIAVVFTNPDATLFGQLASIVIVGLFVTISSAIVWTILKATMGIRVSAEEEMTGLDVVEIGVEAYPEFTKR